MESDSEDALHQNLEYIWKEHQIGEGGVAVFVLDSLRQDMMSDLPTHVGSGSFVQKILDFV